MNRLVTTAFDWPILLSIVVTSFPLLADENETDKGWKFTTSMPANNWFKPNFDDSKWTEGTGGFGTSGTPGARVGTEWNTNEIWLRKTFSLESVPTKAILLIHHDEDATVFVNGKQITKLEGYTTNYQRIALSPQGVSALRDGENLLAVHCRQTTGGQFIDAHIFDSKNVPRLPRHKRQTIPLFTRWHKSVTPDNVWPEYPRPQMVRSKWTNLNGHWDFAITPADDEPPTEWQGRILVPFCIESSLSGVQKEVGSENKLWYRREFQAKKPANGNHLLLHFGAVDWRAEVFVNGKFVGGHQGGYDPFSLDITNFVNNGTNELTVSVWDPTDVESQPRGKQVQNPRGIWYTSVTGIWQTVWLEPTPATYIRSIKVVPDLDHSGLFVSVFGSNEADARVVVSDMGKEVARVDSRTGRTIFVPIKDAKLWSPDSPHLYDLKIDLLRDGAVTDSIESYTGIRKIEVAKDENGVNRMFLNGKALFQFGPLDQGWWPDGLYTAPSDESLKFDVEMTKAYGFNMTRKHVKVEPARWYYWCDKLGLLVWQDMPNGDSSGVPWDRDPHKEGPDLPREPEKLQQFEHELRELIRDFGNHPSIVTWVPFNERWGQFNTEETIALVRRLDPTRLVNSASGGNFAGVGDILDVHNYPDPAFPGTDPYQAVVCGEYGGLGLPVEGHTLLAKGNWGYRSYKSKRELTDAYLEKIEMLKPMIRNGLSGAIYTQITDVEIETNGLMTYDREVLKLDPNVIGRANRELYQVRP